MVLEKKPTTVKVLRRTVYNCGITKSCTSLLYIEMLVFLQLLLCFETTFTRYELEQL